MCFSRWYRPPEVILQTDKYDHATDIWSFGCTFAELVNKEANPASKRNVLFKGKSCYPISPKDGVDPDDDVNTISSSDQLIKIIDVLGYQDMTKLKFLNDDDA